MCVQSSADSSAAYGQIVQAVEPLLQTLNIAGQQVGPTGYLLPNRERRGVLQMGTPDLDDIGKRLRLGVERVVDALDGGDQIALEPGCSSDVHRRRECVIRRLRHVDIVMGM